MSGVLQSGDAPVSGGTAMEVDQLTTQVEASADHQGIEGITLLGGEPFAQAAAAWRLARATQLLGLSVMVFSGFTLQQLRQKQDFEVDRLLDHTDILVDGPYRRQLPDSRRRWIGSTNQKIHFLTARYQASDPCWSENNTLEIRMRDGEIQVNGFPAKSATGLWQRMTNAQ